MERKRVLIAFDKFKDSLSAEDVVETIGGSLRTLLNEKIEVKKMALADGGDGFVAAMKVPYNLSIQKEVVTGPLGDPVEAEYGHNEEKKLCVVEMASASGLFRVPLEKRNPMKTTTKGTGELLMRAYNRGFRKFLLGIGGSATNDGGLGALQALGLKIFIQTDEHALPYEPETFYGGFLPHLHSLKLPPHKILEGATIEIACDVTSPFVGENGALFSGQKGASEEDKKILEKGMIKAASLMKELNGIDVSHISGAGAGGGISGGFVAALCAALRKGTDIVSDAYNLEHEIEQSDVVLTGEGSFDRTSLSGKIPYKVIELCQAKNKPVVVICGRQQELPADFTVPILDLVSMFPKEVSMSQTKQCLHQLLANKLDNIPVLSSIK